MLVDDKTPELNRPETTEDMGSKGSVLEPTTKTQAATITTNDGEDSATESLPPSEELIEEPHDRSDGSDSGLGELLEARSEDVTAAIVCLDGSDSEPFEIASTSTLDQSAKAIDAILNEAQVPRKSNLKRKHSTQDGGEPSCKKKRGISFDSVTVYYFPRTQGYGCVPTAGGISLGMTSQHSHLQKFSIAEHASERGLKPRQVLRVEVANGNGVSSSDDSDSDEEPSDTSEAEVDLGRFNNFIKPVPPRQRRLLLRAAGIRKIDLVEKDVCKDIRTSREFCGCGCKNFCDPDTCSCSQAGIKCQVDRRNFPCGCSREYCGNSLGRIEFNPMRVRTHFIHTLMRLELEKKQKAEEEKAATVEKTNQVDWMNNERLRGGCYMPFREEPTKIAARYTGSREAKPESRLHEGNCTNLHYGPPGEGPGVRPTNFGHLPARGDSLDLYTFREDCYQQQAIGTERKTLYFGGPGQGFHFPDRRFSGVGFPGAPYSAIPNQYTQPYQFGNFAAPQPTFNPYGNFYTEFCVNRPLEDTLQQANSFDGSSEEPKENQFTTSLTAVGHTFSDFLHGRFGCANYEDASLTQQDQTNNSCSENGEKYENANSDEGNEDCDENFGEIIKKSMEEIVSV